MTKDSWNEGVEDRHGAGPSARAGPEDRRRTVVSPAAVSSIDTRELRNALGCFATGITIVTARSPDGQVAGVTANSFCSVSLDPPLVLWCLAKAAPSRPVFVTASHFAIHVLAEDEEHLSARFSTPSPDKFEGLQSSVGLGRAPLLNGAAAVFECRCEHRYEGGDHLIMVGRVERYRHSDRLPLLFHSGRYCAVGRP